MGPTATGKTQLAVELVQHFPLEIVSVDSAMVYRGMDIGTAKPDAQILQIAAHRLIDFVDPSEVYSAARFCADAIREMQEIHALDKIPLLVGGTMLYFRALTEGLSELPPADPEVRQSIDSLAKREGWRGVHARLREIDPQSATRIHPNDPQRLQRALEVYEITGYTLSELQAGRKGQALPYRLLKMGLMPEDRQTLHEKIAVRFADMLNLGLVEEVSALYERGDLRLELPSMRAVGYGQVWQYLDGHLSYEEMKHAAVIATRQLAKRQITWLRSEQEVCNLPAENLDLNKVFNRLQMFLELVS